MRTIGTRTITKKPVNETRERCANATPAPWEYFYKNKYREHHVSVPIEGSGFKRALFPDGCPIDGVKEDEGRNAEFIAHARQDIPTLLDEVERLQRRERAYISAITKNADNPCHFCSFNSINCRFAECYDNNYGGFRLDFTRYGGDE